MNLHWILHTSIKLFGRTVVVRDTPKQSIEVAENSRLNEESERHSDNIVKGFASNNFDSEVGFGFVSGTPRGNVYCHVENMPALPWYTHPNLRGKEHAYDMLIALASFVYNLASFNSCSYSNLNVETPMLSRTGPDQSDCLLELCFRFYCYHFL
ncbi:hypothetical protein SASPL_153529 [Salvia splendens]|uniref:Uncharacterized protein n=1 Tax=Salvia splendens TaxID=180675 RepID=A0A8X8VYG9_SALSN|nr:hypothetical protein SASPL_153529 [Salvia splendens]